MLKYFLSAIIKGKNLAIGLKIHIKGSSCKGFQKHQGY